MQISHPEADRLTTLLHYMKGGERFSETLTYLVSGKEEWCPFTHDHIGVDRDCYNSNPSVQTLIAYVEKYAACCRYLDCNPFSVGVIEEACRNLTIPERMASLADFAGYVSTLEHQVGFIEPNITGKLNRFTCFECERLDEALECLRNCCFHASVVMAVSAVESRIAEIVRRHDEALFRSRFAKATLGQLVQLFDNKSTVEKPALKNMMPEKHKPLLALLNQYRVFSAHPKGERCTVSDKSSKKRC